MKPIRLSRHAAGYSKSRGFTASEVENAIRTQTWEAADLGRFQCRLEMPFNAEWNGQYYARRQVRPIFVEEDAEILVVTVYTYFYRKERKHETGL